MSDQVIIVIVVAAAVIVGLFIFRRQLKEFIFKADKEGVSTGFSTHKPAQNAAPVSGSTRGVSVSGNRMTGWLQRIFVRHNDAEVNNNVLTGTRQEIVVAPDSPLVVHLHQQITQELTIKQFQTLCLDLGRDYAALPGARFEDKTRALLDELAQQQRLPELIAAGRRRRPELSWEVG